MDAHRDKPGCRRPSALLYELLGAGKSATTRRLAARREDALADQVARVFGL